MSNTKQTKESYNKSELNHIKEYQKIHTRLRILKAQMADIQEETSNLIETLEKLRLQENKNNTDGEN